MQVSMNKSNIISNRIFSVFVDTSLCIACPLVRFNGYGTRVSPLKVALLYRHADMFDETTSELAFDESDRVMKTLQHYLKAIEISGDQISSSNIFSQIIDVLEESNICAEETGAYYSAAIAIMMDNNLFTATIGHASTLYFKNHSLITVNQPTILSLPNQPNDVAILESSLGVNFKKEIVQSSITKVDDNSFAIIVIRGDLTLLDNSLISGLKSVDSPSNITRLLHECLGATSPLIAVFKSL
jgi:hypothetical protein